MAKSDRAKQFSPFAALSGLYEELEKKAMQFEREERRILSDDRINELTIKLSQLSAGQTVTVIYYKDFKYRNLTGILSSVDVKTGILNISDTLIPLEDIYDLDTGCI